MSEIGYIKIWRKVMDHKLYPSNRNRDFTGYEAMCDLILLAYGKVEPKKILKGYTTFEIQRGQLDITMRQLEERWRWGASKTLRFLNYLESENFLKRNQNRWFTVITIVNYDLFNPLSERKQNGSRTEVERKQNTYNESNESNITYIDNELTIIILLIKSLIYIKITSYLLLI